MKEFVILLRQRAEEFDILLKQHTHDIPITVECVPSNVFMSAHNGFLLKEKDQLETGKTNFLSVSNSMYLRSKKMLGISGLPRLRRLEEMDSSTISTFDSEQLNNVDYIID